jgi:hypothetical protein
MTSNQAAEPAVDDEDAEFARKGHYFPYPYMLGFLKLLAEHPLIDMITYDDLDFGGDESYEENYKGELLTWRAALASGARASDRIYVLLQHDVDRLPDRTMAALRDQERLGLVSNVMMFNKKIDRRYYRETGIPRVSPYPMDWDYLRSLQDKGFVFGFHSNAYERGAFDMKAAEEAFISDIEELRQQLRSNYFSPHGGNRDAEGKSNASMPMPESLRSSLKWVHNGHTVRFDGQYSDGAINSPRRDPAERDLRDFVRTWRPGKRYRVLLHPQYYNDVFVESPKIARAEWYRDVIAGCRADPQFDPWSDVSLGDDAVSG